MRRSAKVTLMFLSSFAAAVMNGCDKDDGGDGLKPSAASTTITLSSTIVFANLPVPRAISTRIIMAATVIIWAIAPMAEAGSRNRA